RHEILRTTFAVVDGRHVQVIAPHSSIPVVFDDLHRQPRSNRDTSAARLVEQEVLHSFDLVKGPLLRVRLVRLAKREHLLLISMPPAIRRGLYARQPRRGPPPSARRLPRRTAPPPPPAALDTVRGLCILAAAIAVAS